MLIIMSSVPLSQVVILRLNARMLTIMDLGKAVSADVERAITPV